WGGSSGCALTIASHIVTSGMANYIMFVGGGARDPSNPATSIFMGGGALPPSVASEWMAPYGPAVAANNNYGMLYTRHMYEFGTKHEQIAQQAARQRFNAQQNERSAFLGQPITLEDVMNSRYINYPLHIMESVMPVAGAISFIVTTAERARTLRKPPVYILGVGVSQGYSNSWLKPNQVVTPARYSAPAAYNMSGYGVKDVQFANFYD
ncbi:MAG TPA: thiolase family protein, partial [Dehalococcoidia bacterium]|nr:thiolase family protein [Dehalococcoidia bacterium]